LYSWGKPRAQRAQLQPDERWPAARAERQRGQQGRWVEVGLAFDREAVTQLDAVTRTQPHMAPAAQRADDRQLREDRLAVDRGASDLGAHVGHQGEQRPDEPLFEGLDPMQRRQPGTQEQHVLGEHRPEMLDEPLGAGARRPAGAEPFEPTLRRRRNAGTRA